VRMELAGDRLDQVMQRDDALHLAVLVDHEGQVRGAGTELVEQLHAGDAFGHVERRLAAPGSRSPVAPRSWVRQPAARAHHAEHVVEPAAHQRESARKPIRSMRRRFSSGARSRSRHTTVRAAPSASRSAGRRGGTRCAPWRAPALDHARAGAFGEHGVDFFLGHRRPGVLGDASTRNSAWSTATAGARTAWWQWPASRSAAPPGARSSPGASGRCAWAPARRRRWRCR
jgi:hypothetical protein